MSASASVLPASAAMRATSCGRRAASSAAQRSSRSARSGAGTRAQRDAPACAAATTRSTPAWSSGGGSGTGSARPSARTRPGARRHVGRVGVRLGHEAGRRAGHAPVALVAVTPGPAPQLVAPGHGGGEAGALALEDGAVAHVPVRAEEVVARRVLLEAPEQVGQRVVEVRRGDDGRVEQDPAGRGQDRPGERRRHALEHFEGDRLAHAACLGQQVGPGQVEGLWPAIPTATASVCSGRNA